MTQLIDVHRGVPFTGFEIALLARSYRACNRTLAIVITGDDLLVKRHHR